MRRSTFAAGLAATLTACGRLGADRPRPYVALDAQADQLRQAFNAEQGKVRVLMLVSPT